MSCPLRGASAVHDAARCAGGGRGPLLVQPSHLSVVPLRDRNGPSCSSTNRTTLRVADTMLGLVACDGSSGRGPRVSGLDELVKFGLNVLDRHDVGRGWIRVMAKRCWLPRELFDFGHQWPRWVAVSHLACGELPGGLEPAAGSGIAWLLDNVGVPCLVVVFVVVAAVLQAPLFCRHTRASGHGPPRAARIEGGTAEMANEF